MSRLPGRCCVGVLLATALFATDSAAEKSQKPPTLLEIQFSTVERIAVLPVVVDVRHGQKASVNPNGSGSWDPRRLDGS